MYRYFISLILILLILPAPGQDKKIGLVLSGGGASGLAHVGVLKALESEGIQIDYIVGTSIGALVGGYYAAGYSPAQIEAIITAPEFRNAADGLVEMNAQFYLKRENFSPAMINWKFNLDSIFETNVPNNFISSVPIDLGLMEQFAQASAVSNDNFDSLLIPFRCLASDITNKQQKVFRSGKMAAAIRASMTYPFYIEPITIDGGVMMDGGLYNNFPVDIMCKEFKPDYIIASNVSAKLDPPTEDNLISQVKSILIRESNFEIQCVPGLIIESKVEDFGTFNFNKNDEIILRGYETTIGLIDSIKAGIGTMEDSAKSLAEKRKAFNSRKSPLRFDKVQLQNIHPIHEKYFRKKLFKKQNEFGIQKFRREYLKLASDPNIKSLYPTSSFDEKDSLFQLSLKVKKEKQFKASFGGVISTKPFSTGFFELDYQTLGATALNVSGNIYFGSFYSSTQGKIRWDIPYTVPFYLEGKYTINQFDFFNGRSTFIEEEDPPYIISSENYSEIKLGLPMTNQARVLLGATYAWQNFDYYQNDQFERGDTSDLTEFEGFSPFIKFQLNTLNNKLYPTKGAHLGITLRRIMGQERTTPGSTASDKSFLRKDREWWMLKGVYEDYFLERNSIRIGLLVEGVYSDHPFFQNFTATALSIPAFLPLPENKTLFQEEYRALNYVGAGLKTIYTINDKMDFRLEGYVFQPYEAIRPNDLGKAVLGKEAVERSFIGTFTSVYHSRVGPLAVSLNYFDDTEQEFSFLVHFGYILFNRKAFE